MTKKQTRNGNKELKTLHDIVRENAMDQMLFAFAQGAFSFNPNASIAEVIRRFCDAFGIDDYNNEAVRRQYYRNRCRYIRQQQIFKK